MTYKECIQCGEYLPIEKYYRTQKRKDDSTYHFPKCISCMRDNDRKKELERIEEQGGSNRVLLKPNRYVDELQRQQTFEFLTAIGWKYNEENGIWYDDIKKTKDGEFIGVLKKTNNRTIDGKIVKFTEETLPIYQFKINKNSLSAHIQRAILIDYYINFMNYYEIARKYNTSHPNVMNLVRRFYTKYTEEQKRQLTPEDKSITEMLMQKYNLGTIKPRVKVSLDELPIILPKNHPQITIDILRQIQFDYFYLRMKSSEIRKKYEEYNPNVVTYIIERTLTKL
jgi:hypothetical protein